MDHHLLEVSAAGDVVRLGHLLTEKPALLEPFAFSIPQETPLHVAARNSRVAFISEVLQREPRMGYVQNTLEGMCPIHLAAAAGSWQVVTAMLDRDPGLGFAKDREGRTAAHVAAACGQVEVLKRLIHRNRHFAEARTDVEMETILHTSVRHNQLTSVRVIKDLLGDGLLEVPDRRGNTVLHTAVAGGNRAIQNYLVEETGINVNLTNKYNQTARQLERSEDGYLHTSLMHIPSYTGDTQSNRYFRHPKFTGERKAREKDWFREKQNTILLVATVITGATFQAGIEHSKANEGDHPQKDNTGFRLCNTISFALSLGLFVIFASGGTVMHWVQMRIVLILLWASMFFMSLAYSLFIMDKGNGKVSKIAVIFTVIVCIGMSLVLLGHLYSMFTYLVSKFRHRRKDVAT